MRSVSEVWVRADWRVSDRAMEVSEFFDKSPTSRRLGVVKAVSSSGDLVMLPAKVDLTK